MPITRPVASATVTEDEPATVVALARKTPGETTALEDAVVEAETTLNAPEPKIYGVALLIELRKL
jgi:hypothetical protein